MADTLKKTFFKLREMIRPIIQVCIFMLLLFFIISWDTGGAEDEPVIDDVPRLFNKYIELRFEPDNNSFTIENLCNGRKYTTSGQSFYKALNIKKTSNIEMEIIHKYDSDHGYIELLIRIILEKKSVKFIVVGDKHAALPKPIIYPGAIEGSEEEQFFAIPYAEGIYVPAAEKCDFGEFELWGHKSTMPFTGMTDRRTGTGIMITSHTPWDTGIAFTPPDSDENYRMQLVHYPSMGLFGYDRTFYLDVIDKNGYVEMTQHFRQQLEKAEKNRKPGEPHVLVTLAQKRRANSNTEKLAGAVDFWLGSEDMKTIGVVDDLIKNGISRVLLNFQYGWKVHDNEKRPAVVKYAADNGMIASRYDNYSDIFNSQAAAISKRFRTDGFKDRVIIKKNGGYQEGYTTYYNGRMIQGYRLNSSFLSEDAEKYLEEDLSENSYSGRFIDVAVSCRLYEDYSPRHPMTRKEDMLNRCSLLDTISGRYGMVTGTEETAWWAIPYTHYSEGTMTISAPEGAGENWSTPVDDPGDLYESYTVNQPVRIPLKSLVYHDCHISGWYTGDGFSKVMKDWRTKELLTVLYGAMPLVFPDSYESWSRYKGQYLNSIKVTSWVSEQVYGAKMESHSFVSEDGMVQETRFSNGIRIIVNFSDAAFNYNRINIPAEKFILIRKNHIYMYDWIIKNYGIQNKNVRR